MRLAGVSVLEGSVAALAEVLLAAGLEETADSLLAVRQRRSGASLPT